MLSKRSQMQKTTYCMVPFAGDFRKGKTIVSERRLVAAKDWCLGGEDWLKRDMRTLFR